MKIFLQVCGLVFILFSCQNKNDSKTDMENISIDMNSQLYAINIDELKLERDFYLSKIFKSVKIIPLEILNECLIHSIDVMQVHNEQIFILDSKFSKLFVFQKNGKFNSTIGKIGNGPGEYLDLRDFTIDIHNNEIYLLDGMSKKIHKFNLESNEYMTSYNIHGDNFRVSYIQYKNGKLYYDYVPYKVMKEDSELLRLMDLNTGETVGSLISAKRFNKGWNGPIYRKNGFFFSRTHNDPKFIAKFMDNIISIQNDKIISFLAVQSNDWFSNRDIEKFLQTYIYDNSFDPILPVFEKRKMDIFTFIEHNNFIILQFFNKMRSETIIFDKNLRSAFLAEYLLDDLSYLEDVLSCRLICSDSTGVYGYLPTNVLSYFISDVLNNNLSESITDKDKNELLKLDEESNPVIFYYE